MIKESKMFVAIFSIFLCLVLVSPFSFAGNKSSSSKFISPKLSITDSGIKFDSSATENGFKKSTDEVGAINSILAEYRILISVGSGIATLTMVALFVVNLMKLGNSKGNPQARQKAITALIFTGISTALVGSITLATTLFYNFVSNGNF